MGWVWSEFDSRHPDQFRHFENSEAFRAMVWEFTKYAYLADTGAGRTVANKMGQKKFCALAGKKI